MADRERVLSMDLLLAGDRPSLLVVGMTVARSIEKFGMAIIMPNALGHVVALPPQAVSILAKPRVKDEDLDKLGEDEAIVLMAQEERSDEDILTYLTRRPNTS